MDSCHGTERCRYCRRLANEGRLVLEVKETSPGKNAGIKVGDSILCADGTKIQGTDDFSNWIRRKKAGEEVRIRVLRPSVFQMNADERILSDIHPNPVPCGSTIFWVPNNQLTSENEVNIGENSV